MRKILLLVCVIFSVNCFSQSIPRMYVYCPENLICTDQNRENCTPSGIDQDKWEVDLDPTLGFPGDERLFPTMTLTSIRNYFNRSQEGLPHTPVMNNDGRYTCGYGSANYYGTERPAIRLKAKEFLEPAPPISVPFAGLFPITEGSALYNCRQTNGWRVQTLQCPMMKRL